MKGLDNSINNEELAGTVKVLEIKGVENEASIIRPASIVESELRSTGLSKTRQSLPTFHLLITTILGVMGGFISGLVPFRLLIETWYPFVGGAQLISGHHLLWSAISYGVTKKKTSMFLTATVKGLVMFFLGSTWGILEVPLSIFEAASLVAGFILLEKCGEGNTFLGWGIASGIGNVTQVPLFWALTGKFFVINNTLFLMAVMFGFASGVLITGVIGKTVIDRLRKAEIT
jgi:hypothetical protein